MTVAAQIEELLDDSAPTLARLEHTLTDGYAHALALEAELWRLERSLGELARRMGERDVADFADELRALARRLTRAERELESLRALLRRLHDRARAAREASRASA
jgi:predicted  nucleic acid-binding Zn-ribbon protein